MRKFLFTFAFVLTALMSFNAQAQLGTAAPTGTLSVKIDEALDLNVTSGSTANFDFNTIAKLDAGIETLNAVTLTYKSNQPWYVTINADSENFTGSAATPMPASVVKFKLNGSGTYKPLSTTPTALSGSSAAKNQRGTATFGVDYRVDPGYIYEPANDYGIVITYTISNI